MKYSKGLGIALLITGVLAIHGAEHATASILCENTSTPCNMPWKTFQLLNFSLVKGQTATLATTGGILEDTCSGSTVSGSVTNVGSSTATPVIAVQTAGLGWTGCTNTTKTLTGGEIEVHNIAGTDNGTATAKGFAVTVLMSGLDCAYGASTGIDLGELTISTGTDAVLHVNTTVKRNNEHSNVFCPETAKWVATYTDTNTTPLFIETSGN